MDTGRVGRGLGVEDHGGGEERLRASGRRPGEAQAGRAGVLVEADGDVVEAGGERDRGRTGAVAVRGVVEDDGGAVDPERGAVVGR